MRLHVDILFILFGAFLTLASGFEADKRALGRADIPPCGLTCLLQTVPAAGCSLLDIECQCKSEELTYSTAACILANCTMADSLGTAKVQAELCNLTHESKTGILFASLTIVYATVCVFVALRFATRLLTKRVRSDDWCILAALLLATATYTSAYQMTRYNFGSHLWDLEPGQFQMALKYFYVCWNLYVVTLGLVKVSLIAFYLHVFHDRRFRIVCWIVLGYIILSSVIIQFLTIFSCTPIQSFWDRDIKGTCLDVGAIGFANSANAILQDLMILIMPMPSLYRLQMKRWRKIAVAFMFAVGAFGCITTIIRLHYLAGFKISLDPTWDYTNVTIWTGAELAAGIVCASLPAVRQLLVIILPSRFQTFLTNRSRSRSIPGPDRGQIPNLQRNFKGQSVFPVPTVSQSEQESFGVTTDISTSSWAKSQIQDLEQGHGTADKQQKSSIWNPIRTLFPKQTRSFQTSFWSSVDRNGEPTARDELTRRPSITGSKGPPRTEGAETTGNPSLDEQVELLQVPRSSYQPRVCQNSEGDDITALPQLEQLPRYGAFRFSPVKRLGC
ncbi:cytidine and deoxycytidylate deaminase zinc-binding region [Stagonosporopsis vannaccii]|nr:cytidine and deoxycytidylate deaminase zinc-binding region [Stagonosporopsis vannaccii]